MKEHERIFITLCFNLRYTLKPRDIIIALSGIIPHKRCLYYLDKWYNKGFYEYGVALDLGWFYIDKLTQIYKEILVGS